MKNVPIPEARRFANEAGATRLLMVYINDEGDWGFTTFGRTKSQCAALGKWADQNALELALRIASATPAGADHG